MTSSRAHSQEVWDLKLGGLADYLRVQAVVNALGVFGAVSKYFQFSVSRHLEGLYFLIPLNLGAVSETWRK